MVINSMFVAGTLLLSLLIAPDASAAPSADRARKSERAVAVTDSFAPPSRGKKKRPAASRPAPADAPADEVDEDQPPPRRTTAPAPRRRAAPADESEDTADASEEEEEEDKPRVKKKRRRVVEEEEEEEEDEEDDAPMASLPVVMPRMVSFQFSPISLVGRSFSYNTPLQKESTFPRLGISLALEAYPLIRMPRGWFKRFGVAFSLATEFGAAALMNATTGASLSFPVTQRRWTLDVRYAILAGERIVILPAIGIGNNVFDLKSTMSVAPTLCDNSAAMPCLTDIGANYLALDLLHLKIAATESLALSLAAGYYLGVGAPTGNWRIGNERVAKVSGYHGELGADLMLTDWLAVRGAFAYVHYAYAFSGGTAPYTSASETYYGLNIGAVIFTR